MEYRIGYRCYDDRACQRYFASCQRCQTVGEQNKNYFLDEIGIPGVGHAYFWRRDMAQKRNYKFTNRKHSEKSVMSTVFGTISLISLAAVIYLAYRKAGEAPVNYGVSAILILFFAMVGLVLGIMAVREKDKIGRAHV